MLPSGRAGGGAGGVGAREQARRTTMRRKLSLYLTLVAFAVGLLGGSAWARLSGPKKRNAFAAARIRASSNDLRYLCQDNCGSISSNDVRYFCQESCGSIS